MAWTLVAALALGLSLAYHLQLRLAGVVAIETATSFLNREIRGELSIGELQNVSYEKIVATNVVVRDAEGRAIIEVTRLAAWPDWSALWRGVIRIDHVRVRGGEVRLFVSGPDEDTVSLAEAFQLVNPGTGPPGNPPRVVVDDVVLDEILVHGDVPGLAGLRVEDVRVRGRVDAQRDVRFTIWEGRGALTGPYPGRTPIDNIVGFFDSDLENEGLEFYARAHRGDDRVRARIRLLRPELEEPPEIDLRVAAEPLSTDTLREMEVVPDLGGLSANVRGHARLFGPADDLTLRADLHAGAGRVRVRGRLPSEGTVVVEAETGRLRLDQLIAEAPASVLSGRARLELAPEPSGAETRRLHVELDPLTIDDVAIPSFTMDGVLEEDALRITALDAEHAGGETQASGRVGFDGSLDVHVSARLPDIGADPNVRRAAPGAHGSLAADLDLRAEEGAANLRFDGRVAMRNLRYGSVRASRLTVRGRGGGELPAPRLDLEGDADGLALGELSLGRAEVTIRGGGEAGYELEARSIDEEAGTRVAVSGRATVHDRTWRLVAPDVLLDLGDGPWRGTADVRFTPGRAVELSPVVLAREGERIVAEGTYRFRGDDAIDVQLLNVDLAHLRPLAPEQLEGVGGTVDGQLVLRGDLTRRPQGRLSGRIRDGTYAGVTGVTGHVDLALEGDTLTTDVALDLGGAGELVAEGPIRVPPAALRDPRRLVEEARFEGLRISAADFDVGPLLALAGVADDVRISGRITTDAELSGTLRQPGVRDAVLVLDRIVMEGWDPLRAKLHLGFGDERLSVHDLWLADSVGELLTAEGDLPLPLEDLPRDLTGFWRLVRNEAWSLSVRLPQRRLDSWPQPLVENMPPGLAASASVTASNRDGAMQADVDGVARWVDAAVDAQCARDLRPLMTIRGHLEHDVVTASISGFFGSERASLTAEAAAGLPFDEWVQRGGVDEFPSTEIVAHVRGAEMGQVPWLCSYGRGPIHASVTAKDLLTGDSVVGAVLDLPRLQIWEAVGERGEAQLSTEYRVHVRAGSTPERDALTACTILGISGAPGTEGRACREAEGPATGELLGRLRVPVRWNAGELLPEYVESGVITSSTEFEEVHVEPVLTLVPGIVSGDAIMDGEVNVRGTWDELRLSGGLDLSEGHVQIEGLGQHLYDIAGRIELRGDEAVFPADRPLSARDAGGLATAFGRVGFEGLVPRRVNLELRADDFPVRREGMVLAWLSGRASIEGDIEDERTASRVRTRDFLVRLPDQSAGDLQPLQAHGDILIVGEERPVEAGEAEGGYPVTVHIDATDPFWVRRSDFAALVTAQIDATYREPSLRVGGWARIRRGTFEIFGKRFELQGESSMTFDPSSPEIDPHVNITATYEVPGRRGVTVTVTVTGTLTEPEIGFSSTETSDRAEIIALLISGGRRDAGAAEREASEQAASFLAGLTAGILTLGLRQELGDVIPMLAIESEGAGGTRVRVGFNANDLIPDFLRDFVTAAYIEGFVTAAADSTGSSGAAGAIGGGVTVEFTLPEGFLLRGTYVPIDNGSLDVLFEP